MDESARLKPSYLIQRLKKPYPTCESNPFAFGGGLLYGGFNKEAYAALNRIFRFDYMGSAEFEFGAVPKCMNRIVQYFNDNGVTGTMNVCDVPVFYICHKDYESDVKKRISELYYDVYRLKENSYFHEALDIRKPNRSRKKDDAFFEDYIGWIELDNDFMFFIDERAAHRFVYGEDLHD